MGSAEEGREGAVEDGSWLGWVLGPEERRVWRLMEVGEGEAADGVAL